MPFLVRAMHWLGSAIVPQQFRTSELGHVHIEATAAGPRSLL